MNSLDIVVFDLETTGLSLENGAQVIQVAGKAYQARTLEPYPVSQGGEFCSMMRPANIEQLDSDEARRALEVNKKTKEEILAAPDAAAVWPQFVEWVSRFNPKKNKWDAPLAAGKNIRNFDLPFVHHMNLLYSKKKEKTVLFNTIRQIDLEDFVFAWFENENLPNWRMDTLRDYFGMDKSNGHDALWDAREEGHLIIKFLKLNRELRKRVTKDGRPLIDFKTAFSMPTA